MTITILVTIKIIITNNNKKNNNNKNNFRHEELVVARAEEEIQSEVTSSMVNELPTKVNEFLEVIKLKYSS